MYGYRIPTLKDSQISITDDDVFQYPSDHEPMINVEDKNVSIFYFIINN